MTKATLQQRIETLQKELEFHQGIKTNCSSCEHSDGLGFCLMWDCEVPDDVANIGCDDWEFDNIPF